MAGRFLDGPRLPQAVAIVLSLAILGEIIVSVRSAHTPERVFAERMSVLPTRRQGIDLEKIINAHMFGKAAADIGPMPSAAQKQMLLEGTITLDNSGAGLAIVASKENSALVYKVGSELPDALRLLQVFSDHVILERGSQLQSLYFSKSSLIPAAGRQKADFGGGRDTDPHSREAARDTILRGSDLPVGGAITRALNLRPASRDGSTRGIRVYGTNVPALKELGLAVGDVIHEVNGVSMDVAHPDGDGIDLQAMFENGESVTAIIERHGVRIPVTIDANRTAAAARQFRISRSN